MTQKEILLEQMAACHNQKSWFVPMNDAIAGLTEEQASQKDEGSNHSVQEIVNHLIYWNERYLNSFKGIAAGKIEGGNEATFTKGLDWNAAVKRIDDVMSEWERVLKETDESKLEGPVSATRNDSWYSIITHITIHNAYHIGQIVCIRKMQGTWDEKLGVQ